MLVHMESCDLKPHLQASNMLSEALSHSDLGDTPEPRSVNLIAILGALFHCYSACYHDNIVIVVITLLHKVITS